MGRGGIGRGAVLGTVLVLLSAAPAVRGQDAGDGGRAAAATAAAAKISAFGNWCKGRSYKALAREQYEEALRLDPEDWVARSGLGHRKDGTSWKAPAERPALVDAPTTTPAAAILLEKEAMAAWSGAALALAGYARSLGGEAKDAWEEVLRLDPGNEEARTFLRLKGSDTGWLSPGDEGPAAVDARFRALADEGPVRFRESARKDPQSVTTEQGIGFTEVREPRFSVRSMIPAVQARALMDDMIRTESLWTGTRVVSPRSARDAPVRFVVAETEEQYFQLLDEQRGKDDAWKKLHRMTGGCWPESGLHIGYGWRPAWVRDSVVHNTTHFLLQGGSAGWAPPWITEGAGVLASTILVRSAENVCFSFKESSTSEGGQQVSDWNEEIRNLVRRGEDPGIRELLALGLNDLGRPSILKARSFTAWLVARAPVGYASVLARSEEKSDRVALVRSAFGARPEALERRWRYWVRRP